VLRERLVPGGRGTCRTVWADQDQAALWSALEDLRSPSLFGGPQLLVVRHADAVADEAQERLIDTLQDLGGGTVVLVVRGADQRRRLFAACAKAGAAFVFSPLADEREAVGWVLRLARERGHEIAAGAAGELVDRVGFELGVLAGELDKLSLHVGPGARIERAHVEAMVAAVRTHQVQEFTDRLAARDVAGAARALRQLIAEGEPPIRLVAFVAANIRRALHVAELTDQGMGRDEIARALRISSWLVERSQRRGPSADLVQALFVLERVDVQLKSGGDAATVLDAALLEIAGATPTPQGAAC
jgi:DNA polymerase III subunit delta